MALPNDRGEFLTLRSVLGGEGDTHVPSPLCQSPRRFLLFFWGVEGH